MSAIVVQGVRPRKICIKRPLVLLPHYISKKLHYGGQSDDKLSTALCALCRMLLLDTEDSLSVRQVLFILHGKIMCRAVIVQG